MKYKEWLRYWLENCVKPSSKLRTYNRYMQIVKNHIESFLGDVYLEEITPVILQSVVTKMLSSGNLKTGGQLSSNSVNGIITVLQCSLKSAYDVGACKVYVADRIKRPRATKTETSCFSLAEQKLIEEKIMKMKNDKFFGVIISLYTGLRIGELLSLLWEDVDLDGGMIFVSKICHYVRGYDEVYGRIVTSPKTSASKRVIPIPKGLIPKFKDVKSKSRSIYVVSNGLNPISIRSYQRSFEMLLKQSNIAHRGFHSLRHTFATRALECGMDVKTLSEVLGHSSPSLTLSRYAHSLMEHKIEMMNRVGDIL